MLRLCCFLLCLTTACQQPSGQAEQMSDSTASAQNEPDAPSDTVQRAVDGGEIAMPGARRRALIKEDSLWKEALRIHYNALVVDGHIDTPSLMVDQGYQLAGRHRTQTAHVDLPRMYDGGLDAAFFSVYVAAGYGEGAAAVRRARAQIDVLKSQVADSDSITVAYSAEDVRRITESGRKAALMGLEGGHALARSPDTLRALYDAGIRYVTLTHSTTHSWADASQSPARWSGLTSMGRQLVREMNRLGMLVDLSHVSDSTFYDALEETAAPPILSHSSARALVNNVRNVSDQMLRALAEKDGVIMINFFDPTVNANLSDEVMDEVYRRIESSETSLTRIWYVIYDVMQERGLSGATTEDIIDHIDHAVQVAGVDHVGLGSDFDGVNDLPAGMHDVTRLPWITYALLKRGYSESEIYKILGGNALRVLEDAEHVAQTYERSVPAQQ